MNVLLTSVGRRSYLVNYFKEALGDSGKVIATNIFKQAAGMAAADVAIVTPPANHPDYISSIIDICNKYNIGLLCSLHDLDVYILSQNQKQLDNAGILHTLPSANWGRICLDKYECTLLLEKHGIPVPKTVTSLDKAMLKLRNHEIKFPLIIKARAGFGSLGLTKCYNESELIAAYHNAQEKALVSGSNNYMPLPEEEMIIVQEAIEGQEICLGVVNDLQGAYKTHFACEVHSMRAGESDWATTLDSTVYKTLAHRISGLTNHKGIWGLDFLNDNGTLRAVDVNPRFTGDYPFHHLSGVNIPSALIKWAKNQEASSEALVSTPDITCYKDLVPRILAN
ncbi:ATP-grasp domain-containing protein [Psychrobacter pacificensis]|uniref:ATP-grasp domain-containing protein n=1 Tax=Psychrobacter pacificensis TaxID=112002 RepID=UPI003CFC30C7